VITGGVNVSPVAIETRLRTAPGVDDVAVAGIPDLAWGERVVAYVVPAVGASPTLDALRDFGRAQGLTAPELPRGLRLVGTIPRTGSGKVLRRQLTAPDRP
jgi:acyl-CoA synthetase (AMP-forming)/AMP-acid ligase II